MFDLGFQELIIIFVVALLVFGPKKLPEVGRSLGRGLAELKKAMRGIQDTIREEESQIRKEVPDLKNPLNDIVEQIRDTEKTVVTEMKGVNGPYPSESSKSGEQDSNPPDQSEKQQGDE